MVQGHADRTWEASNEVAVADDAHAFIAALADRDAQFGREATLTHGRGVQPKRSLVFRVGRRAFFELKTRLGPFVRRMMTITRKHWSARVADRARVPDGAVFAAGASSFEVHSLSSANLAAVLAQSTAEFWVLTREHGQLLRSALKHITNRVLDSDAQMWFGDSRNVRGVREFRPRFSRLLLRQVDALGPVVIVRTATLREVVLAHDPEPQLWPLALGLSIDPSQIALLPEVLGVGEVTMSALGEHETQASDMVRDELQRSAIEATVSAMPLGRRDVRYAVTGTPLVSLIIPTRGTSIAGRSYLVEAIRSITTRSSYPHIEIVIVADEPTPQAVVDEANAIAGDKIHWVRWSEPFNFSSKMNLGAACATGEYLLFLNDDIEVVAADWIQRMISLIGVDGVGHVGALLFFENQTIQHAGHLHRRGVGHVGIGQSIRLNDPNQLFALDQPRAGVTAACSVMTRELFQKIGGFSTEFPGNYNDVDLCLKVRDAGFVNAVSGYARLYHFESITREATVHKFELERLFGRWWHQLESDDYSRG